LKAIIEGDSKIGGSVKAPPSKSYTHRAFIAAMLSEGETFIGNPLSSADTEATLKACEAFGAETEEAKGGIIIRGVERLKAPSQPINCRESASTLRFLIPVAALAEGKTVLTGEGSLLNRPVGPLVEALRKIGVKCWSKDGKPPVLVEGPSLRGGEISLPGNVSSQFFSGLIFACPLAERNSEVKVEGRLESKPYVDLTVHVVSRHGVRVEILGDHEAFKIPGGQRYRAAVHKVPGDFSSASFLMAAAALTSEEGLKVEGLNLELQNQPDIEIINVLRGMGARVEAESFHVKVSKGNLRGITFNAEDWPDLVPVVAALACHAEGETRITGAGRLRIKESDRLAALSRELSKMGVKVEEKADGLVLRGGRVHGAEIDPHGDHRIAMACAVAALKAEGETVIFNAECVGKSYPEFFQVLRELGGRVKLVE